jgi:hypothetical protein
MPSGHLPIDFHYQIIYNGFIEKKPFHSEKSLLSILPAEKSLPA